MMTLLGVIFGIPGFCVFISCLRISLLEGVAIALLSIGVLFLRPYEGVASVIASRSAGGVLARRLLPAAVVVPLILGWLRMEGEEGSSLYARDWPDSDGGAIGAHFYGRHLLERLVAQSNGRSQTTGDSRHGNRNCSPQRS